MPDKEKEIAGLPIGGVFVILAILLGYFIYPDQPFKTSRQSIQDAAKSQVPKSAPVEARLWEDPFEAVKRSPDYQPPQADQQSRSDKRSRSELCSRILDRRLKAPGRELVILGAMVFGGEYAESSEMRRRGRYALLSALAEIGYFPDNSNQLDYFYFFPPVKEGISANPPAFVPYESFSLDTSVSQENSPAPHVFVLWLNQDHLNPHPLTRLGNLISEIKRETRRKEENVGLSVDKLRFKLLGPADSATLKNMVDEDAFSNTDDQHADAACLHDVEVFCWGATAENRFLLDQPEGPGNEPEAGRKLAQIIHEKFPSRFHRTIGTDRQLMKALVDEMKLRGVTPCSDHIALISEWDTLYGRTLPKTLMQTALDDDPDMGSVCRNIHKFSYMRGIDGQLSKADEPGKAAEPSPQGNKKGGRAEAVEKPVGNSQFDYLRRLARDLKGIDLGLQKEGGIKAIGILGSDIYDKLLVLQAAYELFPGVIFFTTDLDARFLHPDELQWTRNLVIASSFGLRLHPDLQANTPPFRDSYQTALFFAARLALGPAPGDPDLSKCLAAWLRAPRVFEVGRTGAIDLETESDLREEQPMLCAGLTSVLNRGAASATHLHPESKAGGAAIPLARVLAMAVVAVLFLSVLYVVCVHGWQVDRGTSLRLIAGAGALAGLVVVGALLVLLVRWQEVGGEPLWLLEGVSLWPTVYLRLAAFGLAVGLIVAVCRSSKQLEKDLQDYFTSEPSRNPDSADAASDSDSPYCCPEGLWRDYRRRNTLGARIKRVWGMVVGYFLLSFTIILAFGKPFAPYRGDVSNLANKISLYAAIICFILLLFWVVDATSMAVWFIKQIQKGVGRWSGRRITLAAQRFGVDEKELNDWVGLEVIIKLTDTDNKFIYYPILVIILLWVSRLSYFDRWDLPPGLLIVILLGLGFSISCAIRLRRRAEQFRKDVLANLWEKQVRLAGEGDGAKGLSKQIEFMIQHIKSIRSGAFVPFVEQPWVRATLIFITSGGGLTALQYLPWFQ
jgi:hypothetical protein